MITLIKVLIIQIILILNNLCFCHGINYTIIEGGIGIEVKYDDGTPMAGCEFKVFSPNGEQFQTGLTDKNGRFSFIPDKKGNWKIEVDDALGHGIIKKIFVSETLTPEVHKSSLRLWQKILIGVSIIFGITGIYFYFLTQKRYKKDAHT